MKIEELLTGLVDIHIHAGPSLIPREVDSIEMAYEAERWGYRAIVIKDHHNPTASIATLINEKVIKSDLRVFGGICLNNSVGGLNPKAVEVAIGFGAKIIWMPTVSSRNHINKEEGHGLKFPKTVRELKVPEIPIDLLDSHGRLVPSAEEVLKVISGYPDIILATGHCTRDEVTVLVEKAHELGIKRLVVNHPTYMVDASLEDMKYWASLGALIEHTAVQSVPESILYSTSVEQIIKFIKAVGIERTVLSSDYGQVKNGSPAQGMAQFLELLIQSGFTINELKQMTQINPANLLGLQN